jgi:hypothetical protein
MQHDFCSACFVSILTYFLRLFLIHRVAARAQIIFESMHTKADVAAVKHSLGEVRDEALTAVQVRSLWHQLYQQSQLYSKI